MDNASSQWALTYKGYSRDFEANAIVGLCWTSATLLGSLPWFERVGTNTQLADAVSRCKFDDAKRLRWKYFDADLTEVWGVIVTSVEQHFVATKAAATATMMAVDKQRSRAGLPVGLTRREAARSAPRARTSSADYFPHGDKRAAARPLRPLARHPPTPGSRPSKI